MAEKLDYTIQIDEQQYDVTAADSLHADLANQVEKALIVNESVRKNLNYKEPGSDTELKDIESLTIGNLQAEIGTPNTAIGVITSTDTARDIRAVDANNAPVGNSFAYKGDFETTLNIVPSSGGVFTGPIYAPDIDAGDSFNINKFQVTNYNSVDTIIRELKGFPVYEWTGSRVLALTEGNPPTMLPFKVILYTGNSTGWDNREKLRLINSMPDGTEPFCDTECKFFLINVTSDPNNGGRILLGTYTPTSEENPDPDHKFCTYEELRVKEADHADNADTLGSADGLGSEIQPIYLDSGTDGGEAKACYERAGGTGITLNNNRKYRTASDDPTATTASFYAPTQCGTKDYVLLSGGSETDEKSGITTYKAPTWANQNTLSVKDAQNVTEQIGGTNLNSIFVFEDHDNNSATPEVITKVLKAADAESADTVTKQIGTQELDNIFVYEQSVMTAKVQEAAHADSATISDKLHIYPLAGNGSTDDDTNKYQPGTAATSGNYIIYGSVEPGEFAGSNCTNAFKTIGNIYIKIPANS